MSGGTSEVIRDDSPLVETTHKGASGSTTFRNKGYHFDVIAKVGLAAENATQSTIGNIETISDHEITVDNGVTWDYGDTLKVYCTASKGSIISTVWTDLSRGWKSKQSELIEGWRDEDIDLNRDGERVWSEGQPEGYR